MKLNPKKCSFGLAEGVFLGYVITPEGIKPCPDKTSAVLQLPSPQTIKETLKKCIEKSDFHWTTEAEQAFQQLKQHLPADRTGDGTDASLLHKPCVTRSGTKLLTNRKAGIITGLCSKKASKIFSGTSYRDFLNEIPSNALQGTSVVATQEEPWTLFMDGSSCVDGSGAGLILTNPDGIEFTITNLTKTIQRMVKAEP
nr:reverse transcriptase domain-containing protein [Tanacetum cinerariifolium]